MAKLANCKACGGVIAKQALACPNCGQPIRIRRRGCGCGTLLLLLAVGLIVPAIVDGMKRAPPPQEPPKPVLEFGPGPGTPAATRPVDAATAGRMSIYAQLHWAGMLASEAAGERFSLDNLPTDPDSLRSHLASREAAYNAARAKNWHAVIVRNKIDRKEAEAIYEEGSRSRWPVGDRPENGKP